MLRSRSRLRTVLRHTGFVVLAVLLALTACRNDPLPEPEAIIDSSGSARIQLPTSLSEYLKGAEPEALRSEPFFQANYDTFGYIADVATSSSGLVAVLDRMERRVIVFDSTGLEIGRFGREGQGPGEFLDPWALAWMGDAIIVWQVAQPFLTVVSDSGIVTSGAGIAVEGDWQAHPFRDPVGRIDFPFQMGEEDITLRLGGFGVDRFGLVLQDNERLTEVDLQNPEAYLTIWDSDFSSVDTLLSLPAPPMARKQLSGDIFSYGTEYFTPRSQWTAGDGWYAFHLRRSSEVIVRDMAGVSLLALSWPDTLHEPLWEDRENRVDWMEIDRGKKIPKEAKERYASEWSSFSPEVPEVTALYGMAGCLWVSSFSSGDFSNGVGLTLLILHVDSKWPPRVVRIPRKGSRLRSATHAGFITTYEDEMDVQILERYVVPDLDCTRAGDRIH